MNKQTWTIAKINLKNISMPYFITGLIFAATSVQTLIYAIIMASGVTATQGTPSSGMYLWLLIILAAIYIPTKNFRRVVNLGGRRDGFFWGSITSYAVLSGVVSLVCTVLYYTAEQILINTGNFYSITAFIENPALIDSKYIFFNMIELFGWSANGIFFAFTQQFAFLLLLAAVVHTLASIQDKWYGWVVDIIIGGILGVFIPIAPLREWLLRFFNLIIFEAPYIQIPACLILAAVIYYLNKFILAQKAI